MDDWRAAVQGPAVLVTVAVVEGSGPREPGARMLVGASATFDTIGGGHLELRALEIARAMLAGGSGAAARRLERFALGPSLGQCCGGVVHLAFELFDPAAAALLRRRRNEDSFRVVALDGALDAGLFDANGALLAGAATAAFARARGTHVMRDRDGRRWLVDAVPAPRAHLVLFGAGHVGAAIVRALAELPCTVTWVDERDHMFPPIVPGNVRVEASDTPEALVAAAPPGASFLVMTHSHALDQRLAEAIMARPDAGWFGLIGSLTKRRQFEHRLRARGVPEARIGAMVCPVGIAGIANKAPAVIAASVCAQLLMVWEAAEAAGAAREAIAAPLRLVAHR
ncbi:xanthine dehydrogenase accessory protein XdhC [Massilia glaciei]|uniref:Xanthine dehydrogenase accessory protein XdhC n=1 Tax=Massilia glaciei TaxID=1524097 RepID=A0A2U2HBX8_9BURK|nr:xanthine dehydrogenase accessory protein XdhC [Massilia glaciei]PWF40347.1 xanthine dehydrogenase accessory protein XdhC [Massilia glaciei]